MGKMVHLQLISHSWVCNHKSVPSRFCNSWPFCFVFQLVQNSRLFSLWLSISWTRLSVLNAFFDGLFEPKTASRNLEHNIVQRSITFGQSRNCKLSFVRLRCPAHTVLHSALFIKQIHQIRSQNMQIQLSLSEGVENKLCQVLRHEALHQQARCQIESQQLSQMQEDQIIDCNWEIFIDF